MDNCKHIGDAHHFNIKIMKGKLVVLTILFFVSLFATAQKTAHRKGILILGSANMPTLQERVATGYRLYKSKPNLDYIIVSGGCDAHNSGICEATEMSDILNKKGVPQSLIYKEERSQSTFQNYCYSRNLKDNEGDLIIKSGDSLFVVSNHWHAIPVAARFRRDDQINAQYYIVGQIEPKATDEVNYGNLYSEKTSDCICEQYSKK